MRIGANLARLIVQARELFIEGDCRPHSLLIARLYYFGGVEVSLCTVMAWITEERAVVTPLAAGCLHLYLAWRVPGRRSS